MRTGRPSRLKPLDDGRRELAARYVPCAEKVAGWWSRRFPHLRDEIHSAAQFRLVQCAGLWDEGAGVRFATYLLPQVRCAILDVLRKQRPNGFRGVRMRDEAPAVVPIGPEARSAAMAFTPAAPPAAQEDAVRYLISGLPPGHKRLMDLAYSRDLSIVDAGKACGLSRSKAYAIHSESVSMIRASVRS